MSEVEIDGNRVLMALYYYHPYVSGVSICAKRVAEDLVAKGYEVTVLTSRFDKELPKEELINGVRIVRRPVLFRLNKGVIMPTYWLDIIRYSWRNNYVNPHLPMADSGLSSIFIPKRKQVTTYQCDINLGKGIIERLIAGVSMALMHLQLYRSRIVVPSTDDYFAHSKMKRYLPKAHAIYPTVTADDFHQVDSSPLFDRLDLKKGDVKIGFVGRVVYEKGIDYLLNSIPYLKKDLAEFKIIIVGEYKNVAGGSTKDQLDKIIRKYPDNILFTGYLDDIDRNRFYSGLDVLVLPSIDPLEAYGMVQVEAMLCGTPVVASNLPGVREIINKTGFGRISKIRDSEDIAKQIIEVVGHKERYNPVRHEVYEQFNPEKSSKAYAQLMPFIRSQKIT